jgi:ProP effector
MRAKNDEAGAPAQTGTAGQTELFPVFVADHRAEHCPLKIGIHLDLTDRGVLRIDECRAVFRVYVGRRKYQKALANGGARLDLDGNPAGEVTPEQVAAAEVKLAAIKRKMKARREAERAKEAIETVAALRERRVASAPRRLGLADLKAAAQARRAGAE